MLNLTMIVYCAEHTIINVFNKFCDLEKKQLFTVPVAVLWDETIKPKEDMTRAF